MASLTAMATKKGESEVRARAAMAVLAERSGTTVPEIESGRLSDHSHHEQQRITAESAVTAFMAEQLQSLAADVDALRAEIKVLKKRVGK